MKLNYTEPKRYEVTICTSPITFDTEELSDKLSDCICDYLYEVLGLKEEFPEITDKYNAILKKFNIDFYGFCELVNFLLENAKTTSKDFDTSEKIETFSNNQ